VLAVSCRVSSEGALFLSYPLNRAHAAPCNLSTKTGFPGQPLKRGPDGYVSPMDELWPISDLLKRLDPRVGEKVDSVGNTSSPKRPTDSLLRVALPFGSDPAYRAAFVNFRGHLRFGKILEELDFFAGVGLSTYR